MTVAGCTRVPSATAQRLYSWSHGKGGSTTRVAGLRIAAALLTGALIASPGLSADAPPKESRQVHASIQELMDSIIDPSADTLWRAVGTVVDNRGFHDALPRTPEEWHEVRRAAVRLIEGANLLMLPGRAAAPPGTRSEVPGIELEPAEIAALIGRNRQSFDGFALTLQGVASDAMRAADSRNAARLMDAGGRMEEACEACHQSFWYPLANSPQPTGRSRAR